MLHVDRCRLRRQRIRDRCGRDHETSPGTFAVPYARTMLWKRPKPGKSRAEQRASRADVFAGWLTKCGSRAPHDRRIGGLRIKAERGFAGGGRARCGVAPDSVNDD